MSEASVDDVGSRAYWLAISLLAALLVASALVVAGAAFFADDDFRWLSAVRDPGFSLIHEWAPLDERSWWSYRPLAMHTYFYLGQAIFGLEPMAFQVMALGVHFAGGALVYLFCRQLRFAPPVAAFAGLLAVSRPPSMDVVFWASAFSYFAVATLSLATLLLFRQSLERYDRRLAAGSLLTLTAALFCQESAIVLPGVLYALACLEGLGAGGVGNEHASPGGSGRLRSLATPVRTIWPHLAIVGVWAIWRFQVIAPFERSFNYQSVWGWNLLRNAYQYASWVSGGDLALALVGLSLIVAPLALWRQRSSTRGAWQRLLAFDLFCSVWILACLLPFVPVRMTAARFAIALEVPLCVLFAGQLAVLWQLSSGRARLALQGAMIALLLAAVPFQTLRSAHAAPRGAGASRVFDAMSRHLDELADGSRVVMLYGAPGQLSDAWKVRREAWTGTPLLQALAPGRLLEMSFQDVERDAPAADFAPGAHYFSLTSDGPIPPASEAELERFFRAGLGSKRPGASAAAAQRLALLLGPAGVEAIASQAAAREGPQREAIAQALLLVPDPAAERAAARLIPSDSRRAQLRDAMRRRWGRGPST